MVKKKIQPNRYELELASLTPTLFSFKDELQHELEKILKDAGISLGFPIQARVKTWKSLSEKFQRVALSIKSIQDIQDLVGLRVVLLFGRDVERVCSLLQKHFVVVDSYNTQDRLKADQFGYASNHLVVQLPDSWLAVPTFAKFRGLKAEIQVRTLAQHIWAEASYDLQYKREKSVPPEILRPVYRVSALLETIDLEFERVLKLRDSYRKKIDITGTSELLNVDVVEKTLDSLLPKQNKSGDEDFATLLDELAHFKIATQEKLKELIEKNYDKIIASELKQLAEKKKEMAEGNSPVGTSVERTNKGVFFTFVGLTRTALSNEFGKPFDEFMKQRSQVIRSRLTSRST